MSRQVLNTSREGASTVPLGSLFQYSVTLKVKTFFLMWSWNFLCFTLFLTHPRIPSAFLGTRAYCWLMANLSSTSTHRSCSAEQLFSRSAPSLYWCMRLFLPRCRTLHLPLLDFIRFLTAHLFSPSRSCWMAARPSSVSVTPPSFVSSANCWRYTLSLHPAHWWRSWTRVGWVLTPGEHP